ncbi:MAG: hypothetical protein V1658_00535 [Candidatus Micrarchaeota archaeon]
MNYLLMAQNGNFSLSGISELKEEDSLVLLIALDREKLASEFEADVKRLVREAESLKFQMEKKKIASKVLIEWGARDEILSACLAREGAILLK